jgi:hypothetical protein
MKRWVAAMGLAVAGCGSVTDSPACVSSAECGAGAYCASAEGERHCWPDVRSPVVAAVTVACLDAPAGEGCRRDGTVRVTATATDAEELAEVRVALSLDPAHEVAMVRSGAAWTADLPLRSAPMAAFETTVTATVTAVDGARNVASRTSAASVPVTRLRWTKDVDPTHAAALTPAAVMPDGTVIVAANNGKLYFVNPDGTQTKGPITVGSGQAISAAPAIGERAIWVGSEDGWLRAFALDGSGAIGGVGVNSEGAVRGSVAVLSETNREWGFVASGSGRLAAASTTGGLNTSGATYGYAIGPVLDGASRVSAVNALPNATAVLRSYSFDGAFTDRWNATSPAVGTNVAAPLATDAAANVVVGSQDGRLFLTTPEGTSSVIATLPGTVLDSPVILSDGDIIVGDQSGALHRLLASGTPRWPAPRTLGGPVLSAIALSGPAEKLVVPTRNRIVSALADDGTVLWSTTLGAAGELRAGNIHTPPGQPAGQVVSTVYFPTSDGRLHAVIVDGQLDPGAPWPKAFHDARNTSNAGTAP